MSYRRVVPRDLFNEANLLKCLGKISVSILDNKFYPVKLKEYHDDEMFEGFYIEQTESGDIVCTNYRVYDPEGDEITFFSGLNSRRPWPLMFYNKFDESIDYALNEDGSISQEFMTFLENFEWKRS